MRQRGCFALAVLLVCAALLQAQEEKPYYRNPAISPNGSTIAFVFSGDIYTVPAAGGAARLLVSHKSLDQSPKFSPDGKWLAFTSYRSGGGDVYMINLQSGELRRLTFHDSSDSMESWSPDGQWVYFISGRENVSSNSAVYKIRVSGGMPVPAAYEEYEPLYNAAVSPDGATVAFNTNDRVSQPWRRGPLSNDAPNIWLKSTEPGKQDFRQFTTFEGKDSWPMWAPDGAGIYFVSDEGNDNGAENIFYQSMDGTRRSITSFKDGRVLYPDIARASGDIVFERDFGVWLLPAGGSAHPVAIGVVADEKDNPLTNQTYSSGLTDFALSPDEKKVAFIVHGEVFVAPAKKKDDDDPTPTAFRVTDTDAREEELAWDKDSNRLIYISDRTGNPDIFTYDFITHEEKQLTDTPEPEGGLVMSPDNKWCAYYRGMEEIRLIKMEDLSDQLFQKGFFFSEVLFNSPNLAWSPDSRWIAYADKDAQYFQNIWAKKIEGDEAAIRISDMPNISTGGPLWSSDGEFIVYSTSQHRVDGEIYRVDLKPSEQEFEEDDFDKLFVQPKEENQEEEKKEEDKKNGEENGEGAAKAEQDEEKKNGEEEKKDEEKPVEIDPRGLGDRTNQLAGFSRNSGAVALSPDDKNVLFTNSETGRGVLWSASADPTNFGSAKEIMSTSGLADLQFAKDKKTMWVLNGGQISTLPVTGGNAKPYAVKAEMEIDFNAEKLQSFREAWYLLRDNFYDGTFNGQDWNAVYARYLPYIAGARDSYEMNVLMNLMLGSLNASHSGVFGGSANGSNTPVGDLGVTFDPVELVQNGRFKVADIVPEGPVYREKSDLKAGDYLLAVNGTELGADSNINRLLERANGKRVKLAYAETPDGERKEVNVKPVRYFNTNALLYNRWVERNREYVDKISNGRLGYLHISAMGYGNLRQFELDLSAQSRQREGVVIDVRYNSGGYVAPFVLDVLMRRTTQYSSFRGRNFGPSGNAAGDRIYDKPTVLVQNERSLSNAEMFAEGYRKLGLGKIVGSGSNGWVIWTWGQGLLNGMFVRLPRMEVSTLEGEDLDEAPREPDVKVVRPIGESHQNKDSQLDAAVRVLLDQIDNKSAKNK